MPSGRKEGQKIEKREDRNRKIASIIANMELGAKITPTSLAKSLQMHPDTLRDLLDLHDTLKEVGFETLRDKDGKLKLIIRNDENLDIEKILTEMRKDILDIKIILKENKINKR
ncbi:MAG: hypothetical protein AAB706_00540 [Patescibacteria group bacterium]